MLVMGFDDRLRHLYCVARKIGREVDSPGVASSGAWGRGLDFMTIVAAAPATGELAAMMPPRRRAIRLPARSALDRSGDFSFLRLDSLPS